MTFQPRMQNKIGGFSVIGGVHRRQWNGIVADIWNVNCAAQAGGYYVAQDPRLFILLDQRGSGATNVRLSPRAQGRAQDYDHGRISYIPAGMELWADLTGIEFVRHLDIHFDATIIGQRLMEDIDPAQIDHPRLHFSDPRLIALAELIAAECENPEPLHDLYGDGLTLSLLIDVLQLRAPQPRRRSALAAWQLRRAVDYIEENCVRNIRLEELASLTGLSQSHFSHDRPAATSMADAGEDRTGQAPAAEKRDAVDHSCGRNRLCGSGAFHPCLPQECRGSTRQLEAKQACLKTTVREQLHTPRRIAQKRSIFLVTDKRRR